MAKPDITLGRLVHGKYTSAHFRVGKPVRIYTNSSGVTTEIEVREGVVLDCAAVRRGAVQGSYVPALRLHVTKAGRVNNRTPDLRDVNYVSTYSYQNIGLREHLPSTSY